jgi:hypothetical protein
MRALPPHGGFGSHQGGFWSTKAGVFVRDRGASVARTYAYSFSLLVITAVMAPALIEPPRDDFPLSTYPMFSRPMREARAELPAAFAVLADGTRQRVPPALVTSSDVLQALVSLRQAVRAGPHASRALCAGIAARLSESAGIWRDARQVEIVTQTLDAIQYFAGAARDEGSGAQRDHAGTVVHARCTVLRP